MLFAESDINPPEFTEMVFCVLLNMSLFVCERAPNLMSPEHVIAPELSVDVMAAVPLTLKFDVIFAFVVLNPVLSTRR